MDDSESELLKRAVKFANRLNGRFNLPSYGMDERLSSREARSQVAEANDGEPNRSRGSSRSVAKKRATTEAIDHIAAQIILENWFSAWNSQG